MLARVALRQQAPAQGTVVPCLLAREGMLQSWRGVQQGGGSRESVGRQTGGPGHERGRSSALDSELWGVFPVLQFSAQGSCVVRRGLSWVPPSECRQRPHARRGASASRGWHPSCHGWRGRRGAGRGANPGSTSPLRGTRSSEASTRQAKAQCGYSRGPAPALGARHWGAAG